MVKVQENKNCLVMYDVRGIQSYIFRTNKMQEIIGASQLIENIIIEGLDKIIALKGWSADLFLTKWEEDEPDAFLNNEEIQMQVLFIGGGNAYVLFREEKILKEVNRALAKYVLEKTYSLNLAVAVIEKSENYKKDYDSINLKMREIKAKMPETKPVGAMPFMSVDTITGYPLTQKRWLSGDACEYVCTESALKRDRFPGNEDAEKILDNMVTEKGDSSHLAVVHIDGNNMGARIRAIMEDKQDYTDAIVTMRAISRNIKDSFRDTFDEMGEKIDAVSNQIKPDRKGKLYRKIVVAGDDITFVCNAKAAIYAVEVFLKSIAEKKMYEEKGVSEEENRRKYGFSACAGIAFFNSHFPFTDAYEVAEECCKSAKSGAKSPENRNDGKQDSNIGSYLDYQICSHIKAADLQTYRMKHYMMPDGSGSMLFRPYYVPCKAYEGITDLNERNKEKSIDILWKCLRYFQEGGESGNLTKSRAKRLRNAFALGMEEVKTYCTFLESREAICMEALPEEKSWYDALEIIDFCLVVSAELETDGSQSTKDGQGTDALRKGGAEK